MGSKTMRMCREGLDWLPVVLLLCLCVPGCKRQGDDNGTPPGGNGTGQTAGPDAIRTGTGINTSLPTARDTDDHPDRPRALPRTGELPGWIKTEPVRLLARDEYGGIRDDAGRPIVLADDRIRNAAVCRYWDEGLEADVLVIEAATPMDAYAAFAMLTSRHGVTLAPDRSIRSTNDDTRTVTGWQGDSVVQIRFSGTTSDAAGAQLFNRILFNMLAVDPPLLLQLVPAERLPDVKLYLVRSVATLKQAPIESLRGADTAVLDARLGLDGERFMSLAVVRVAGEEGDNLLWLIEYDDAAMASAHHERYRAALDGEELPLDRHTILSEPKGRYLTGSWAAELESVHNLLSPLRSALPELVVEG